MNIRLKLSLQFALLAAGILFLFSLIIYSLSEYQRQQEFYFRLGTRALTTARLLITVEEIDRNLLDIIEKNSVRSLFNETIEVYDYEDNLIYSRNRKVDSVATFPKYMIAETRQYTEYKSHLGPNECVGLHYRDLKFGNFVILFSAEDRYGWALVKAHPTYRFSIEYDRLPEEESSLNVNGNETLLRTAFINLMENGCKFSQNQSVKISISFTSNEIRIAFTDDGIGIPQAEQEYIFRPFYRASNAQNQTLGNGIGLALSRRIIELHDGTLQVQSSSEKGSIFEVRLPV